MYLVEYGTLCNLKLYSSVPLNNIESLIALITLPQHIYMRPCVVLPKYIDSLNLGGSVYLGTQG